MKQMNPNKYQVSLMEHSLGNKSMYRNYFNAEKDHNDYADLMHLVELGYMAQSNKYINRPGDLFYVTEVGKTLCFK